VVAGQVVPFQPLVPKAGGQVKHPGQISLGEGHHIEFVPFKLIGVCNRIGHIHTDQALFHRMGGQALELVAVNRPDDGLATGARLTNMNDSPKRATE